MRTWMRWTLALLVFAAVVVGTTMYSSAKFDEAKSARIEAESGDQISVDSIYSDRVARRYDPDYDRSRYQQIAKALETDPVFIDEYQVVGVEDSELAAIRKEVGDLTEPIYVAILTTSQLDAADGDGELTAARIATELSDDRATVLVANEVHEDLGHKGIVRQLDDPLELDHDATVSRRALDYVRALKSTEAEDAEGSYARMIDDNGDPIVVDVDNSSDPRDLTYPTGGGAVAGMVLGLIVGGGVGIIGVLIWRSIGKRLLGQ
ncbi:MAG: hypothetical protein L0K12_00435 [Brevibacterium aurantiacum]|nr:hypothetical protein [Brevibacterium aurantiacum]